MPKRLPDITHLQFLVLEALSSGEQAGRDLRALLLSYGVKNSAPAFYQMMGRLEEAALVEGHYEQKVVGSQRVKERRYRLARLGTRALAETRGFYRDRLVAAGLVRRPSHA